MNVTKAKAKMLPTVQEYLNNQIDICPKSQKEIAFEIGYEKPNIITMFKQGLTKLPINKVGPMAKALGIDPAYLLRIVISDYMPEMLDAIEDIIGVMCTNHEREMISIIRSTTKEKDYAIKTQHQRKLLRDFARSLE